MAEFVIKFTRDEIEEILKDHVRDPVNSIDGNRRAKGLDYFWTDSHGVQIVVRDKAPDKESIEDTSFTRLIRED